MNRPTLRLGFSTCPNDTFIFYGLASGLVQAPFAVEPVLADVEELNALARRGGADICKVSVAAAAGLLHDWTLLRCGGAMGRGVGPVLVARRSMRAGDLAAKRIAVPGRLTTANLLLGLMVGALGMEVQRIPMRFDAIMPAVLAGEVDAGVVIHEGRFTYAAAGLAKVEDLGSWWEGHTGLPLPLGIIAARRDLGGDMLRAAGRAVRASLELARTNPPGLDDYVRMHAQEMEPAVIAEHIATFVTDFSLDVGVEGERAVAALLAEAAREEGLSLPGAEMFVRD